ncbi:MAG: hypothetical protein KAR40_02945 [Candidatus Sabulitectum sp.]|nr:hypothetical protein [Candidatus Sabulitectum sp.]
MRLATAILVVLSLVASADQVQVPVNSDPIQRTDADWLVYDDGTAAWLTWGGVYRGVWFNTGSFVSGTNTALIEESEFWFFHHSMYPWDTSDVYIEIWDGDATQPLTQLDQTLVTAVHFAPVGTVYSTPVGAGGNFWVLANTEMSSGGWPAVLGDSTPGTHSFYSDDFVAWEPWGEMGDYLISVLATASGSSFEDITWGLLKATF